MHTALDTAAWALPISGIIEGLHIIKSKTKIYWLGYVIQATSQKHVTSWCRMKSTAKTINNFDAIVSIGQACDATFQIRRIFGQPASFPFDWLITPFSSLKLLIESNFSDFLNEEYLIQEHHYVMNTKIGIKFLHDFHNLISYKDEIEAVRAKYIRRISRWNSLMESGRKILFVRSQQYTEDKIDLEDAKNLFKTISDYYINISPHLLIINPHGPENVEFMDRSISLLTTRPSSPFRWEGDDDEWENAFHKTMMSGNC